MTKSVKHAMSSRCMEKKKMSNSRIIDLGFSRNQVRGSEKPYLLSCRVDDETVQWLQRIKDWMIENDIDVFNKSDVVRKAIQFGNIYIQVLESQHQERVEQQVDKKMEELVDAEKKVQREAKE